MEQWFIRNKEANFSLIASQFGISEVLTKLIINRDISSKEEFREYLSPSYEYLFDPLLMKDLEKACDILKKKIEEKKKIRIIGDYDVDGIMSTYILQTALEKCGAEADYEIPDRIKDGYGISSSLVEQAFKDDVDTILTCDNGIAAIEQVKRAKELGMTILVTDHHDIPYIEREQKKEYFLPAADAIVNPKQADCNYPIKEICGAVVAFKLVEVLYAKCNINMREHRKLISYAAIATVCDVMNLKKENRIIVKLGLEDIKQTDNIGLKALIHENSLNKDTIGVYHLGFVIGPCFNASGRLETAKEGLALLFCKEEEKAIILAKKLKELNDERKRLTDKGIKAAIEQIEEKNWQNEKVLVIYLKDCHESVAGIIAGRIRERYIRPAIVLTKTAEGVKGSGRSMEVYNMYEELTKCKDLLTKFGGHPMAAGLSLEEEKIDILRAALNHNTKLTEKDFVQKVLFDMVLPFSETDISLIEEFQYLEPCGNGNPKPTFARKDVFVVKAIPFGKEGQFLRLNLREATGFPLYTGILFRKAKGFEETVIEKYGQNEWDSLLNGTAEEIKMDFIFCPEINEYNGYKNIRFMIEHYR